MGEAVRALRGLGLVEKLKNGMDFTDLGDVNLAPLEQDSGPANLKNFEHYLQSTNSIYLAASKAGQDDFVFCLGGECALIVGTMASFRRSLRGEPGLLWMDSHGDFNTPETTPSGFIGGMCLAFACGRGPRFSPTIEASRPLVREENVIHLGGRDLDQAEMEALRESSMRTYSASLIQKDGLDNVVKQVTHAFSDACDWIVCHLDVDVIDPRIVPAVNYPSPGGLMPDQVMVVVDALKRTGKLRVFDVAAYNPALDRNCESSKVILKLVSELFT